MFLKWFTKEYSSRGLNKIKTARNGKRKEVNMLITGTDILPVIIQFDSEFS
jgi:hypothetical protein